METWVDVLIHIVRNARSARFSLSSLNQFRSVTTSLKTTVEGNFYYQKLLFRKTITIRWVNTLQVWGWSRHLEVYPPKENPAYFKFRFLITCPNLGEHSSFILAFLFLDAVLILLPHEKIRKGNFAVMTKDIVRFNLSQGNAPTDPLLQDPAISIALRECKTKIPLLCPIRQIDWDYMPHHDLKNKKKGFCLTISVDIHTEYTSY